ncbi:hypothetical protein [Roseiflexus sp.]
MMLAVNRSEAFFQIPMDVVAASALHRMWRDGEKVGFFRHEEKSA